MEENEPRADAEAANPVEIAQPETYRNRKIEEGITNLLKRGKTQKDN